MAHLVKTASVLFTLEHLRGQPTARQRVLENLHKNLDSLSGLGLDLVVFSEGVEALGQSLDQAEHPDKPGPILNAYQAFAAAQNCTVAGSIKLTDGSRVFNSIAYIGPDGRVLGAYHKANLTAGELALGLSPGDGAVVVETPAGRLGGAVCFDLNFEELAQQYATQSPDIITFASMYHGGLMQGAWAYRCRSYFVSALPFHGGGIFNMFGQPLAVTDCYTPHAVATVNLDRALVHLDFNRSKFLDIRRQYLGKIDLFIPPNVGSALITSLSDDLSAMDVVREFELELLDDYFARARAANTKARDHAAAPQAR